jgi:RNA polymerase sigma-70 factor (ECF subfamily)
MSRDPVDADVDRAIEGDEASFTILYRYLQPRLLRYLRVMAGPAAEDVSSETWASVIKDLHRFKGGGLTGFQAWVMTIARRRWVDELRRRGRRPERPTETLPDNGDPGAQDELDRVVADDQSIEWIRMLAPAQAEVITLRVIFGFDVDTTARVVRKSPGAVRVLAHRGLRHLETLIAQDGVTGDGREAIK